MSKFIYKLNTLILSGDVQISEHGYDELADDGITAKEVVIGVRNALVVEEYPNYPKGPCALLLQKDLKGLPIHTVWGVPKRQTRPAVLVTAYRPDPDRWDATFTRRRK